MTHPAVPDRNILLIGASGHTGRRAARRLARQGARLVCMSHDPSHRHRIPAHPNISIAPGSAESRDDILRLADDAQAVVSLAHIRYAPGIARALGDLGRPVRFVAMSSTRGLSRFPTPMREIVRQAEHGVRNAPESVRWTILRPSMIFGGPDDNNLERMARALRRWRLAPVLGSGRNLWQPVFVLDLVEAIVAAIERPAAIGRDYTLAGPQPMAYRDVVRAVARAAGTPKVFFLPIPAPPALALARLWRLARPRSRLYETLQRFGEDRAFDIEPARRDLDFRPIPFENALALKFSRQV